MHAERSGRRIVTIADFLIISLGATSLVILLGATLRFHLAGLRVSLLEPWRPALFALLLTVARRVKWPHVSLLPALGPRHSILSGGASPLGSRRKAPREAKYYAAALVLMSLVPLAPQLHHLRSIPDPGDPIFSAWRLAWIAHQLTTAPSHLFDANIFYPTTLALTYSDAMLLPGVVAAPFIVAGADPLIVANALCAVAFPLSALAFFYAGWTLTGDLQAGFIAGLMAALYPFHFEHYPHLELQFFFWIPLALVALMRLLIDPSPRRAVICGLLVSGQCFSSMYFGIMLATLALPVAALVAAGWHVRFSRRLARSALVLFLILSATLILIAWPYLKSRDSRGDRPPEVVSHYSALPSDYLNAHFRSRTYGERLRGKPRAERQLFPGLSPIVLGLVGLLPPMSVPTIALTVAGTAAADWSFGFNGLTYKLLYDWVLPYRGLRVPARFSIFVGSILMLLSAFAVRRILQRISSTGTRAIVFGVLVVGVYMDLRPRLVLQGYYPTLPPIYAAVSPNMVLAEFPFGDSEIAYMYFSTYHWARLLDGYSGSVPYHHVWLSTTLEAFPSPSTLALLRQEGATHLTVNCAFYIWPSRCIEVLKQLDSAKSVGLVSRATWEGSEVRLYRLNGSEF